MNNKLVIIGFADALSAPEVAFTLMDAGFRVAAFMRSNSRQSALCKCKGVEIITITPPEENPQQAIADLSCCYKSLGASAIMPLNDKALWMCARFAEDQGINVAGPAAHGAAFSLDKRIQIHAASAAGFNVPKTIVLQSAADIDRVSSFPVIVKPALAVAEDGKFLLGKEKLNFCSNRDELDKALSSWNEKQPLLVQTVHQGTGEGLFGFAAGDTIHCWSAHRRVRMMNPKGSGSSACQAIPVSDHPLKQTKDMLQGIGWRGPFMIELLRDQEDKLWFVEMNGRPWGSMSLALHMGFNYPVWAIQQLMDPAFTPSPPAPRTPVTCRHLGRELIHILQVIRGPSSAAIPNWPSIPETLFNVLRISKNDRWYNWRPHNKALFVFDTYNTLMDETIRKWL